MGGGSSWMTHLLYYSSHCTVIFVREQYVCWSDRRHRGLPHYRAAQRVLIYLSQTTARVLGLHPTADGLLAYSLAYSDADWTSKFSTSGGLDLT